jgi:hypothetical protein
MCPRQPDTQSVEPKDDKTSRAQDDDDQPLLGLAWGGWVFASQTDPVAWAGRILGELAVIDPCMVEVERVITCTRDPALWYQGRDRFRVARLRRLAEQLSTGTDTPETMMLEIAELVAKVAYNATRPEEPFAADIGWWSHQLPLPWPRDTAIPS